MLDPNRKFDSRTVERNIQKGIITREEYQEFLDSIEDSGEKCEPISSQLESVEEMKKAAIAAARAEFERAKLEKASEVDDNDD